MNTAGALKLCLVGATGRMGKAVLDELEQANTFQLVAAIASPFSQSFGHIVKDEVKIENLNLSSFQKADIIIDFSHPDATFTLIELACKARKPVVIGTTGHSSIELKAALEKASQKIPIAFSANYSLGIALIFHWLEAFPSSLKNCLCSSKIEETHHIHKKDKPSGTALALANYLPTTTSIEAHRIEETIGKHALTLEFDNEKIELTHIAHNRRIFAAGALSMAKWLVNKPPGLYTLRDLFHA